jgi:NAD-dependent SIR2 family protein deacetylase
MLCLSYYCLCLLFNKIGENGGAGSAWKSGWWGRRMREQGAWGRNDPNNVCTYEYMNKEEKKEWTLMVPKLFQILVKEPFQCHFMWSLLSCYQMGFKKKTIDQKFP